MFSLRTNLADLPLHTFQQLAQALLRDHIWLRIVRNDAQREENAYVLSLEEIEFISKRPNSGGALLRIWGNRGQTVHDFLHHLQFLAKHGDPDFDHLQLILKRKFKELRWGREEQILVSIDENLVRLESKAIGFPSPDIHWYTTSDSNNSIGCGKILELLRCKCSAQTMYKCIARNEIDEQHPCSEFYRRSGKIYTSTLQSKLIDITPFIREDELCEDCKSKELSTYEDLIKEQPQPTTSDTNSSPQPLVAADKVALIISNCLYHNLPELVTPHCDAQILSDALQKMDYKTVTLADLTLNEMRYFIREYRKLLGDRVYAVFYFVGHGFEVNGQCYLLGVDAPLDAHHPHHSLSMDWLLSSFHNISPSLNLLLLDVCRRFIPSENVPAFVEHAEQFKQFHRGHRNMVYGYSTSGGVGAYEVKGEINGVFMKYLKNNLPLRVSVVEMLNRVLADIGSDKKVCQVQVPEIRTTLTHPRSLHDPLQFDGHTNSFDNHTIHWRLMHELPNPVNVKFEQQRLSVTIWFQYCGNFTNKVYILSSVSDIRDPLHKTISEESVEISKYALQHRAHLRFDDDVHCSVAKEYSDNEEGVSMFSVLSGLQRIKNDGQLSCHVSLRNISNRDQVIAEQHTKIGHILITRIKCL